MLEGTELYKGVEGADINAELTADLVGDYLFTDADFLNNLSAKHRNVFQKIYDEVKYLCKVVTAGSKEARELEKVKKAFENAYRAETKNTAQEGGVKYSLNIKYSDGSVEVLADARELTNDQAVEYLKKAKAGQIQGHSYIPVRKDTPQVIIDTLSQVNEEIQNRSLVMQVRKAQQAMKVKNEGKASGKHGSNIRSHALGAEQIVEIINNLDNPTDIIYQTNRYDMEGNSLPNNVAVFVEYNNNGTEGVAVIEFDSSIDPEYIGTEYGDTEYHTVVTVFEPDVERNGMPFDYAEELLSNPDNILLDIERKQPARSATREKVPNTSSKLLSNNSISQNAEKSTENAKESFSNAAVTRYSLTKDVENFDNSLYNEIELPAAENGRVQSEALTWNAGKRNQLITQTLSNGITYQYVIDDDGIVHIYGKEQSANIHDWKGEHGNTNTKRPDYAVKKLWSRYGNNGSDSSFSQNGREPSKDDTNDNYIVSGEGRSNGAGYSKDRTNAYGKPKKRHWHFNEDGSTEVTYSDGTKEILDIAPTEEASSEDGVFFGGKARHSLSNIDSDFAPIGDYNVYGEDVALKEAYPDDYAPIGETPNSQTSVDSENGDVNRVDTEGATVLSTESSTENEAHNNVNRQYEIASDSKIEEDNIANGKNAITTLMNQASSSNDPKSLTVKNAMYRTDIGSIDFVWGFPGKGQNLKKGYGISHIIAKRNLENGSGERTLDALINVIAKATEAEVQKNTNDPGNDRIRLYYDGYTAVLSQKPQGNSWLLTGWENKKETASYAYGEGYDSSAATATMPILTRHDRGNDTVSNNIIAPEPDSVNTSAKTTGDADSDDLGPIGETPIQTVKDKLEARLGNLNTELDNVRQKQAERVESLDERIADLQAQYESRKAEAQKTLADYLIELF